jgi:hypothetical protein
LVVGLEASLGQRPSDVVGLSETTIGGGESTRYPGVESGEDLPQIGLVEGSLESLLHCVRGNRVKTSGFEVDRQLVQATLDPIHGALTSSSGCRAVSPERAPSPETAAL